MNEHSKIASRWASKIMIVFILIYLWLKTLINPVFTDLDRYLALAVYYNIPKDADWLSIIANSSCKDDYLWLPLARSTILFDLGLSS